MPCARRIDRLGALLTAAGAAAFTWLPFVVLKANRIVPGRPLGWFDALPPAAALSCLAALLLGAAGALAARNPRWRLAAGSIALAAVAWAVAAAAHALTPPGNKVVRVAVGPGCWIVLVSLGLLVTDAVTRLRPGPVARVLLLGAVAAAAGAAFAHGVFDDLSVMREYAVNADRFAQEVGRHVALAVGSLGAALVAALPLGMACHRLSRVRAPILGLLNVIQTIPAIALFGILMAPLAALGVGGIGAAPALVALFLYALLPIVANTVTGLERVSPAAVEAAHGMGMTRRQVLGRVELPLALPVILTGVRVALVQNIGLTTIAALIGAGGLGTFVFQGIGQTAIDLVLLGALPTVALAISASVLLDALIESLRRAAP